MSADSLLRRRDPQALAVRYAKVRAVTLALVAPLSAEDQCVQSMPDASPVKWHLAHTSWFFETVVLRPHLPGYEVFDPAFAQLFNSYYVSLGPRHPRPQRGLLTRPSLQQVLDYRAHVDAAIARLLHQGGSDAMQLLELGLHHEQQHQELLLTDAKHLFSLSPLLPAWGDAGPHPAADAERSGGWSTFTSQEALIGHAGNGFAFDNETPRHPVLLQPYALADDLVSCGEYLAFINDGGYRRPELWLSDGWATVTAQDWQAPLYWNLDDAQRPTVFTLAGERALDPATPVCHLSFYEAAAYAEWAGHRLPTEFEWESAANQSKALRQVFGAVWQWTRSSYDPYPGFRPWTGAISEYNGKFMVGQLVLRGGSCATPEGHSRASYRNFFPPAARWQFTGLRLARDL
ncbi:MAG: ergothioneine biosynthesis protein EgtB [Burkholderiaceae bacterium]|nr:ergothioneine biosynthesis protein EgtB [Burkholderiaceae bacterium]